MACKRWNGSAYVDLVPAKFGNNVPDKVSYWNGSRYAMLWPASLEIYDDFNRTATTGAIGPLWNKVGSNSEIASNSFDSRTTDGSNGIYSVSALNNDDGYVEGQVGGATDFLSSNADRPSYLTARVADDGLSGIYVACCQDYTELGSYTGSMSGTYSQWNDTKTTPYATGAGIDVINRLVKLTYIDNSFIVTSDGVTMCSYSGTMGEFRKGKGYRRIGAVVTRNAFYNSASWNSVRGRDIDYV